MDIDELMMASLSPAIEEEVVSAAKDECSHFSYLSTEKSYDNHGMCRKNHI